MRKYDDADMTNIHTHFVGSARSEFSKTPVDAVGGWRAA